MLYNPKNNTKEYFFYLIAKFERVVYGLFLLKNDWASSHFLYSQIVIVVDDFVEEHLVGVGVRIAC
jgi:hypothetical protein